MQRMAYDVGERLRKKLEAMKKVGNKEDQYVTESSFRPKTNNAGGRASTRSANQIYEDNMRYLLNKEHKLSNLR